MINLKLCSLRKNAIYERYKFCSHVQGSRSIDVYITERKNFSKHCEFGDLCDSLMRVFKLFKRTPTS